MNRIKETATAERIAEEALKILEKEGTVPFATVIATVPVRHDATIYSRFGGWFAWLDIVVLVVLMVMLLSVRRLNA